MADIRPIQPTTAPARPRLATPPAVRIAQPTLSRPSGNAQFTIPEPKGPRDLFNNRGFFGDLLSIPGSALKAVGTGISGLPTLVGKVGQTAYGFGEGALDLALDIIDEDIYTSRFEVDLEKGRELGLQGDALVSYAAQRQYPFGSMIVDSVMGTGRRAAELVTAGRYDYGEPGIDYATAFREGNLGGLLIEDIGNVVLAGRGLGAGNVVARGGARVAQAGAPRLGKAIEVTGRFSEEPVATTLRGTARAIAPRIDATGRISRLADPLERIGQAETPLRQAMSEMRVAYQQFNLNRIEQLTTEINIATERQRAAQNAGDMETAQAFAAEVNQLRSKRNNALSGAGLLGRGRQIVRRGKIAEERAVQNVISLLRRTSNRGPLPESTDVMRQRASKLRQDADRQQDPVRAEAQRAEADALDFDANMKEQYPEVFDGKPQPWMEEAAIHVDSGKAREFARLEQEGLSMAEIVAAATDPYIDPAIADRGMLPTEDGVRAAIEFVKAMDAQQSLLNPGEAHAIQKIYGLLREYGALIDDMMMRGMGMPEGPAPFYWRQPYPIPQNLLTALDTRHRGVAGPVLEELNRNTVVFLQEMVRQGVLDQDFFDTYNIDPNSSALFRDLVDTGLKELAAGNRQPLPYMVAYNALKLSYSRLRRLAPNLMLDLDIYPAIMRPAIGVRRQAVRQITGEEVLGLAEQLADLARDHGDVINPAIVKAITNDIRKALDPRTRIENATFNRLLSRINTIRTSAANKLKELRAKQESLTTEERILSTRLIELEQSLGAMETTVRTLAAQQPEPSPRLRAAEARVAELETERAALAEERASIDSQLDAQRKEQAPRLQQIETELASLDEQIKTLTAEQTNLDRQVDAHNAQTASIREALARAPEYNTPETILPLMEDYNEILEMGEGFTPEPVRITDQQVRAEKQRAVDEAVGEVPLDRLYAEFEDLMPTSKLRSRATTSVTGGVGMPGLLDEDYVDYIASVLPNTKERPWFKEFVDEYTSPDGRALDEVMQEAESSYFGESSPGGGKHSLASREFAGIEDWLTRLAKAYRLIKEAEERVKKAQRRPLREYRADLELGQAGVTLDQGPDYADYSRTGLGIEDVRETALVILEGEQQALDRIEANARRNNAEAASQRSAQITEELRQARFRRQELMDQPRLDYDTALLRRSGQISTRLTQIDRQLGRVTRGKQRLGPARRSLQFARQAEPREAARAQAASERAQLRGVGRIRRPAPGAEGPALGELTVGARNYADASAAQLNLQQERNVSRLKVVRRNIAEQDRLEQAATIAEPAEAARLRTEVPLGPELLPEGELPGYLPAGPPRSFFPGDKFEYGIRGEGATPQTRLQATQQRVSGAFVLTLDGMAARLAEVIGQQYRNSVIEEILRDPEVTKSVVGLLGEDTVSRMMEQAETATDAQNIPRNTSEFNQAVQRTFGSAVIEELRRRGYEVASPVRVDPETFAHSPVGDLTIQARPNTIDGNTLVMRQGVRERIVAEYERKGVREVPEILRLPLEKIGNLTARWKSHILPLSLRWQIGDAVGIVMFAWLRGDIPPQQLAARIKEAVGRMTDPNDPRIGAIFFSDVLGLPMSDPALAALFGSGLQARGLKIEENQFIEQLASRLTGVRSDVGRFKRYDTFRAKAFRVNEAINSLGRAAVALENLDRILREQGRSLDEITGPNSINDPVITKAINDSVDATNKTLGAFSDLNPWEKQVMRQVFPFWSWIKFINKAAYELTIDNPDRVLFYAHLGSMASDPDDNGLADWLRGKTPVMGTLVDLSFMNPYADAILLNGNPLADATETFTSISPAIETPRKILAEVVYSQTGREYPFLQPVSRPGYLEGRPEASTRGLGDVLGGAAYLGLKGLVPIARNVFDILPTGTIPGTDIATGPVQRFGQGSLRTTGAYAEPRLSPLAGRAGALLRTFGIPAPLISQETARRQAAEQRQRDEAARLRRIVERQRAGG